MDSVSAGRRAGPSPVPAGAPRALRPTRGLWTALVASDPGFVRLRMAGRTLVTLVLTLAVLSLAAAAAGQQVTVAMLGVVVAMISSIAVNDPSPTQQLRTVALMAPTAVAAVGLATALDPFPMVAEAVFVLVAVGAVLARRAGPRGLALGMAAFMAYFFTLFLQARPGQLPALMLAACTGSAVTLLVRLLLIRPRRPQRLLQQMLTAAQIRTATVLDLLVQALTAGELTGGDRRRLQARLGRTGQSALVIEQQLDAADERTLRSLAHDNLAVHVFDAQLFLERVVAHAVRLLEDGSSAEDSGELAAALAPVAQAMRRAGSRSGQEQAVLLAGLARGQQAAALAAQDGGHRDRFHLALTAMLNAWADGLQAHREQDPVADLAHEVHRPPGPRHAADPDEPPRSQADSDEPAQEAAHGGRRLDDNARQAVQVGLACALAVVVGEALSPARWFWAVITAFVIFTGTSSRGQILSRGWQRTVGTLAGVLAGVLVAAAVGGHTLLSLVLLFGCLFFAVYFIRVSPGLMIFFITTMLALLYGLLGRFSTGLLLLRLEETAAGAAIGVAVSFVVLPASTSAAARAAIDDVLDELDDLLTEATATLTRPAGPQRGTRSGARGVRDSYSQLQAASRPLTHGLSGIGGRSSIRHTVQVMGACEHHARALARIADVQPGLAARGPVCPALRSAVDAVLEEVSAVREVVVDRRRDPLPEGPAEQRLDAVAQAAGELAPAQRRALLAALAHLHAIQGGMRDLGRELTSTPTGRNP